LRTHPDYLQQTRGTLKNKLTLFIGYFRYIAIIKKTLIHYSTLNNVISELELEDGTVDDRIVGFFDEPDYQRLSLLSEEDSKKLMKELMKVVCLAYDAEWWYIILQRAMFLKQKGNWVQDIPYPKAMKWFPRTLAEFRVYVMKCGGSSFLHVTQQCNQGAAQVIGKESIVKHMLRDLGNDLPSDSKSRWKSSVTRHVSHYIIEEMGKIKDKCNAEVSKESWSMYAFEDALAKSFCEDRRGLVNGNPDRTPAIIWPTTEGDRMIDWRNFGPKLCKIARNPLPTQRLARGTSSVSRVNRDRLSLVADLKGRDCFFKHMVIGGQGTPQLHQIIALRIIAFFTERMTGAAKREAKRNKKEVFAQNWEKVILPGGHNLLVLWNTKAAMIEFVKVLLRSCPNKIELQDAALFNMRYWQARPAPTEVVELFNYCPVDTAQCNNGFRELGNHEAFRCAQRGIITEMFLTKLIQWREYYNEKRLEGSGNDQVSMRAHVKIA
jgi:hypothetical protein